MPSSRWCLPGCKGTEHHPVFSPTPRLLPLSRARCQLLGRIQERVSGRGWVAGQVKVLLEAFPRQAVAVEVSTQAHRLQARRDVGERRIRLHVTHSSRTPIACATMSYCCALHTRGESGHACRLLRRNVLSKSCHLTLAFLVRTLAPTRFCVLSRKLIASPPSPLPSHSIRS